jgi:Protein of unknown function (DUF3768)
MADEKQRSALVRRLNDEFRKDPSRHGCLIMTSGVDGEGPEFVLAAVRAVQAFNSFNEDNDPYGEHDFGSFELDGKKLFWKIDYFEKGSNHQAGAETPENALTTDRVLTIMLVDEY